MPYTCFLDGVQFSSGCTLGKANIRHTRSTRAWIEFRRTTDPRPAARRRVTTPTALKLELRPEVWTGLHLKPARTEAESATLARTFYRRPFRRLFLETLVS